MESFLTTVYPTESDKGSKVPLALKKKKKAILGLMFANKALPTYRPRVNRLKSLPMA